MTNSNINFCRRLILKNETVLLSSSSVAMWLVSLHCTCVKENADAEVAEEDDDDDELDSSASHISLLMPCNTYTRALRMDANNGCDNKANKLLLTSLIIGYSARYFNKTLSNTLSRTLITYLCVILFVSFVSMLLLCLLILLSWVANCFSSFCSSVN